MNGDDLCFASASEVSQRLRSLDLSPVELLHAQLARIEALNPRLHAWLRVLDGPALTAAREAESEIAKGRWRGPLHGIPIGIKDLCDVAGVPTTCASRVLAEKNAERDATVVARLRAAGAVILGKLHMTEFAMSGYAPGFPVPVNPWDPGASPGASSSGSGVAVAAGLAFGALGTDTGGSIRFPAAACGVVGLKPTWGRVSRTRVFPLAASLDHVGPMARTVADSAALLDVMAGADPEDPTALHGPPPHAASRLGRGLEGVRVGVDEAWCTSHVAPDVAAAWRSAATTLAGCGARLVEILMPPVAELLPHWTVLCASEALVHHAPFFPARAADYGITFRGLLECGSALRGAEVAAANLARIEFNARLRRVFESADVLACPSAPICLLPRELLPPDAPFSPGTAPFQRFTAPFDLSGSPTLSVPFLHGEGASPQSLQLVGRHGEEMLLCQIGHAFESARPLGGRRPPHA